MEYQIFYGSSRFIAFETAISIFGRLLTAVAGRALTEWNTILLDPADLLGQENVNDEGDSG